MNKIISCFNNKLIDVLDVKLRDKVICLDFKSKPSTIDLEVHLHVDTLEADIKVGDIIICNSCPHDYIIIADGYLIVKESSDSAIYNITWKEFVIEVKSQLLLG